MVSIVGMRGSQSSILAATVISLAAVAVASPPNAAYAVEESVQTADTVADDLEQLDAELDAAAEDGTCAEATPATGAVDSMEAVESHPLSQAEMQRMRLMKDKGWVPTHEQVDRLAVADRLNNFCLDSKGLILACCPDNTIRRLTHKGKELESWQLDFPPQAIACCKATGAIFVAGNGKIAKLDSSGKVLLTKQFPRPMTDEEREELVREQVESQVKMMESLLKGVKAQLAGLTEGQDDAQQDDAIAQEVDVAEQQEAFSCVSGVTNGDEGTKLIFNEGTSKERQVAALRLYVQLISQQYGGREHAERQIRERMKSSPTTATFTGVGAGTRDLFVVCSAPGYSYNAWRLTHDLDDPKLIVKGLRGCCGQMDCQTDGTDLWIPVNGEHLVYHYDRDGKVLNTFGKRDAEAADGFGGCCEPKNLRLADDGYVYCAQSGPPVCVKRFTADGQFQDVACFPLYETGCVRASVDLADGKIFLLSPNEGAIYVFAPTDDGR